jgi:hypothetical protein
LDFSFRRKEFSLGHNAGSTPFEEETVGVELVVWFVVDSAQVKRVL